MNPAHLSIVKAYLLGALPDAESTNVEARYFSDPAFLNQMQRTEEALIRAYLRGRLPPAERQLFENRYLREPILQRRLEEIRNAQASRRGRVPGLAVAAAVLGLAAIGVWSLARHPATPGAPIQEPGPELAVLVVQLSPGTVKGAAQAKILPEVPPGRMVEFQLELPGQSNAGACTVTIDRIGLDGERNRVWSGTSHAGALAGYTALTIDGGFLLPGDYVMQAADTARQIRETYAIRVAARRHP